MSLLITHLLLTLSAVLWIARDAETAYIFEAFCGESFHYGWYESPKRWNYVFTYGWRLVLLCSFTGIIVIVSCRFFASNPLQLGRATLVGVFALLLVGAFAPIPWINLAHRLRLEQRLRTTALRLTNIIDRVAAKCDLPESLRRADYSCDESWSGWHPKTDEMQSNQWWEGILPIVYVWNESITSAVFPVDFETWLAWNVPARLFQINSEFPFHGPHHLSFRVKSRRELRGLSHWTVIETKIESEPVAGMDDRG